MASLTLLADSGTGDVVGIAAKQRSEHYALTVDSVTDDPHAKALALLPTLSLHRHDRTMQLQSWATGERKSPLVWEMTAEYSRATKKGANEFSDWLITVQSNTGAERLFQEIPDPRNPDAERKIVGPLRYAKYVPGPGVPIPSVRFKTKTAEGEIELTQVGNQSRPLGMDVDSGDVSIIMRRSFARMTARVMLNVANYKRGVNRYPFIDKTFPSGTVRFRDFVIDETLGQLPGAATTSYVYPVTLQFVYNQEGHTPLRRTDTYVDDEGYESIVTTLTGEEVRREFRRYIELDFSDLINEFYV